MPVITQIIDGKKHTCWEYGKWYGVIRRTCNTKHKEHKSCYKEASVHDKWKCFSWFMEDIEILKQENNFPKDRKREKIKRIADEYANKGYITKNSRLYKAMYSYEVEITD